MERSRGRDILSRINGVVFMGVPQRGMKIEAMRKMAADQANRQLIESLGEGNSYLLKMQVDGFEAMLNDTKLNMDTVYFYETEESPTAIQVCIFGLFTDIKRTHLMNSKHFPGQEWQVVNDWTERIAGADFFREG